MVAVGFNHVDVVSREMSICFTSICHELEQRSSNVPVIQSGVNVNNTG